MDNAEREMSISYHKFIELIEKDIPGIKKRIKEETVKIRLIDRIINIKEELDRSNYEKEVDTLIYYSNVIINSIESIETDENIKNSISKKLNILVQFQKLGNLDNKVAIKTYEDIIKSINYIIFRREEIVGIKDQLTEKLADIENLCRTIPVDMKKIEYLCDEHSIDKSMVVDIVMYLIKENARVPAPKKKEKQKQAEVVTEPVQVVEETRGLTSEELQQVKETIEKLKNDYEEKISKEYSELLDKYYNRLQNMSQIKRNTCYSNSDKDKLSFINDNSYAYTFDELGEMWRCIKAINIFRAKDEISQEIAELYRELAKDSNTMEDFNDLIALATEDINKFMEKIQELKVLDSKLEKEEIPIKEEKQSAFFAHSMYDFIDEEIKNDEYLKKRLLTRINNVIANGDKKGNNTAVRVKGLDEFDFPTIFAFNDGNDVNMAYVQLPKTEDGQHRIFIITASPKADDLLKDACKRILNKHRYTLLAEIKKIQESDTQELGVQKEIYDLIFSEQKNDGIGQR